MSGAERTRQEVLGVLRGSAHALAVTDIAKHLPHRGPRSVWDACRVLEARGQVERGNQLVRLLPPATP